MLECVCCLLLAVTKLAFIRWRTGMLMPDRVPVGPPQPKMFFLTQNADKIQLIADRRKAIKVLRASRIPPSKTLLSCGESFSGGWVMRGENKSRVNANNPEVPESPALRFKC